MKRFCSRLVLCALVFAPAAAFAVVPGQWTGPYIGIQAGLNRSSLDQFSSENAFTTGIIGGYDVQLSQHFVVGGNVFYEWNQQKDHTICFSGTGCGSVNMGSKVYGIDGRIGFPLGLTGSWMPYLKVGYSHIEITGDASGSDNGWRLGAGIEWFLSDNASLTLQYIHGKYGSDIQDWKNDNYTVGVNFHF